MAQLRDSFWVRRLFKVCVRVFCAPNATILLVYISAKIKVKASSEKTIFFLATIGIFCKSIAGPLSVAKTHWTVNWLQLLNQLHFVWLYTKVFMQNSSQWCLRNVQLLRITVSCCWRRFTHSFCHSSSILGCMQCFWLFTMRMPVSFTFFHKITNIRRWQCFSSSKIRTQFSHTFCNITMIFKVMSQYFPALFKIV